MNANINYDEIPDTSAVQEDLLAALSSQHVTVHTNEEPDFDYMENGDVAFVVKNPHNEENLLIELGGEFSVFFGSCFCQQRSSSFSMSASADTFSGQRALPCHLPSAYRLIAPALPARMAAMSFFMRS